MCATAPVSWPGTRAHVRAVAGHVDTLFAHFADAKPLTIRPPPPPENEPKDEKHPGFRAALEAARLTDELHGGFGWIAADELGSAKAAAIDRKLNERVRASLGLPPRKAEYRPPGRRGDAGAGAMLSDAPLSVAQYLKPSGLRA